ncbi:right-handed parallel beta-helix repeat-containing protein [uncultured Gimesia sp.]|uniref:right-handed parallel beta-helix repeat-containing protein n=1 Tax=uncultured Gimesia sp. TaxID=1678688 RepID=UPI0030DAD968
MCSSNDHQQANVRRLRLLEISILCVPLLAVSSLAAETLQVPEHHKTIQAAIDAAKQDDTILVAPGTYHERIKLKAGLTLKSAGNDNKGTLGLKRAEATIIDGGGEQGAGAGVTMAERSTLDGFTVTNVGLYDDAKWNQHHATHGEQQSHEPIGAPGTAGIGVIGVTCTIKNNIVHHIGYTGIAIQSAPGKRCSPHVYRNVCYRNMGGGIGSMQKSTAVIEANICFQNFYAGIGHDDASPTVINNTCYENIRAGIGISEGSRAIVRGNKCYQNRRAGIGVRTGANTRPLIEHNECYENEMAGIGTREEAAPLIRNNRCFKNKRAGIGSRTHATPTIVGNECFENGQSGIGQQSDAVTMLINNFCHHNKTSGIGFAPCKAGRSTVINNRIIDNAQVAVGVNTGWTVRLVGNELSRTGGMPPIVMVFDGAEVTLTGNIIRGGGVAGIRVAGKIRAENNEFAGTSLRKVGPPNFAIWALPGSDITLIANKFHHWRHALQASEATVLAAQNRISNFHGTALVIQNAKVPANVFDNVAVSANPKDKVVSISGETGVVQGNELQKPTD